MQPVKTSEAMKIQEELQIKSENSLKRVSVRFMSCHCLVVVVLSSAASEHHPITVDPGSGGAADILTFKSQNCLLNA